VNARALAWVTLALGAAAGVAVGYWYGGHRGEAAAPAPAQASKSEVLYWYDPMYPQHRFQKPGKSPFMDMQLVPRYAGEAGGDGGVSVSPRVAQNLGLRTAEVARRSLAAGFSAVGSVEYNERAVVVVQPRAGGFIERLHVRAPLDQVRRGAPLVDMLVPEWAAAQEEYLLLRKRADTQSGDLAAAARQRLVLLGMSEEQIKAVERAGTTQARITLHAPVSGAIAELGAREGLTVAAGATLFRIAGLDSVWVVAEVPEAQATQLAPGTQAEVRVPAYP
jgi:Cu(I)/Ag(I) efflux system membrane fusion protein